ncbi:MAG: trypsin-like peptidase domain-containing protein [Candidatus Hydrogenedentota bacterium]|nr:MAG: trypsin-like peptidase domain-containing protein [Candidatus Hydrogenedentota bacterium]
MKRLLILMTTITALTCGSKEINLTAPHSQKLDSVMRLIGRSAFAHACPVDGIILSAAHVVHPRNGLNPPLPYPAFYAWSDQHQHAGYVQSLGLLPRDLGAFVLLDGMPNYFHHARMEPLPGERVYWLEFDLSEKDKAFGPKQKTALVQRSVSGHLILDVPPKKGASGSCVLNDSGEVVGIVCWSVSLVARKSVGVVVSVAGPWWPGGVTDGR